MAQRPERRQPEAARLPVRWFSVALLVAVTACCPPAVSGTASTYPVSERTVAGPSLIQVNDEDLAARFETAWTLVAQRYWDLSQLEVDWDEVGDRYRARVAALDDSTALYDLLEEMYSEIGDDHSVFVPPDRVAEIREAYGSMPCVAVFGSAAGYRPPGATTLLVRGQAAAGVDELLPVDTTSIGTVEFGMTTTPLSGTDVPIGYIRVPDLASEGVAGGVRGAVDRLQAAGAEGLVVDLRGNPGGRLVTMMQVAGVFTRGFLWRAIMSWTLPLPYPAVGQVATDLPLALLIDENVNSAAEGLAGALQANGRATLYGATTAGNVEAVLPFCLRDGSQAWIATGVLAPLLGATWEGRGVEPDRAIAAGGPDSTDTVLAAALEGVAREARSP